MLAQNVLANIRGKKEWRILEIVFGLLYPQIHSPVFEARILDHFLHSIQPAEHVKAISPKSIWLKTSDSWNPELLREKSRLQKQQQLKERGEDSFIFATVNYPKKVGQSSISCTRIDSHAYTRNAYPLCFCVQLIFSFCESDLLGIFSPTLFNASKGREGKKTRLISVFVLSGRSRKMGEMSAAA